MQAELDYVGSITVDTELARAAGILEYEKVQVVDIDNGNRFETYVIAGEPGSGMTVSYTHLDVYKRQCGGCHGADPRPSVRPPP